MGGKDGSHFILNTHLLPLNLYLGECLVDVALNGLRPELAVASLGWCGLGLAVRLDGGSSLVATLEAHGTLKRDRKIRDKLTDFLLIQRQCIFTNKAPILQIAKVSEYNFLWILDSTEKKKRYNTSHLKAWRTCR